jgi:hypothetical protein
MQSYADIEVELDELSDHKAVMFRDPSFKKALIGVGYQNIGKGSKYFAVYNYDLMVEGLMEEDNMTSEEAVDFISYNTLGVGGDNFPVILYPSH